jgi:4-cresol dehydrogenase (hydroxylating)
MMSTAMEAIRHLLGRQWCKDDQATTQAFARSTSGRSTVPLAVVWPGDLTQLRALLLLAAQHRFKLYPISTGRNWGYGDACAVEDAQVIVSLSRMNRILKYDQELAYVVIEPGVTQGQLSTYLREHGDRFWMDCTGAGPDTSLVGNIMERGFGHSPYGNRLLTVAGLEVLLANGELLKTGFGHYRQARAAYTYPFGVGPFLDGIFTQSNLGIVTQLGLWLMPRTQSVNHFLCSVDSDAGIAAVVDALRPLRMDGTLRSVIHIGNDMRVLSGGTSFPRALANDASRLPDQLRKTMCRDAGIAAWTVSGALYGSEAQLALSRRAVQRCLSDTAHRAVFITPTRLRIATLLARGLGNSALGRKLSAQVALGQSLMSMNQGIPDGRFLAGAYWRRRGGLPAGFPHGADPARDGCGLLWVSPVLPMRGADMLAVLHLAESVFRDCGFDLFATFSMLNERSLGAVLTIAFDHDDAQETVRAQRCYHRLFQVMVQAGYIPYRVGNQSMADLDPEGDSYWRTVKRIKQALDPDGILAPGRYQPHMAGGSSFRGGSAGS